MAHRKHQYVSEPLKSKKHQARQNIKPHQRQQNVKAHQKPIPNISTTSSTSGASGRSNVKNTHQSTSKHREYRRHQFLTSRAHLKHPKHIKHTSETRQCHSVGPSVKLSCTRLASLTLDRRKNSRQARQAPCRWTSCRRLEGINDVAKRRLCYAT